MKKLPLLLAACALALVLFVCLLFSPINSLNAALSIIAFAVMGFACTDQCANLVRVSGIWIGSTVVHAFGRRGRSRFNAGLGALATSTLAIVLTGTILTAGCSTPSSSSPTTPTAAQIAAFAAAAQAKIGVACTAFSPTLKTVSLLLATVPTLTAVSDGVGLACAANAALDTSNISSMINTSLPTAIADVNASSLSNKTAIVAGLTLLQSGLSVALAEYNLSVSTGAAVSLTSATAPSLTANASMALKAATVAPK